MFDAGDNSSECGGGREGKHCEKKEDQNRAKYYFLISGSSSLLLGRRERGLIVSSRAPARLELGRLHEDTNQGKRKVYRVEERYEFNEI